MKTDSSAIVSKRARYPQINQTSRKAFRLARASSMLIVFGLLLISSLWISSASLVKRSNPQPPVAPKAPATAIESSKSSTTPALSSLLKTRSLFTLPLLQAPPPITVTTYAGDCTTPKSVYNVQDTDTTVCAKVTGAQPGWVIIWSNAKLQAVQTAPIGGTNTFTLSTGSNLGDWRAIAYEPFGGSVYALSTFTVVDAANPSADLSISASAVSPTVASGGNAVFGFQVNNYGPSDAAAELTSAVPASATFVSFNQVSGPAFNCTTPSLGDSSGSTNCTIASLGRGESATFLATYEATGPSGGSIATSGSVTSTTTDPANDNNSSTTQMPIKGVEGETCTVDCPDDETCSLVCPVNITASANATSSGVLGAFVTYGAASGLGNCGAISNSPVSGSFFAVGVHTITSSSVTASCTFTVTVLETPAPTISCPPDITVTAADGETEATVNPGSPTSSPSGLTVTGVRSDGTPATFDEEGNQITPAVIVPLNAPYPVGTTGIVWTATDANGRQASCTQRITVNGFCGANTAAPEMTFPGNISVSTGPGNSSCSVALDDELGQAEQVSGCPVTVTIAGIPAGNLFPIGTTTLTYTATDASGRTDTGTQTVTVIDDTPPSIVAPPDAAYVCASEVPAAHPSQAKRGEVLDENNNPLPPGPPFDNCGAPTVTVTETSSGAGSASSPRVITRTFTATDAAGNSASATQTITVIDPEAPTITAPADASFQCASDIPAANAANATASDNCGSPTVTVSDSSNNGAGSTASPLVITRTFTATDAAGNSTSDIQTITVIDNTPPVISCPANIVVNLPLNSPATSMAVSYPAPTATDNCSSATVTTDVASGSVFPVGTTTITATATDSKGNTSSCAFTVTVLYNFTGFFSPVGNLPTLNSVNAGRAIPVKFSLSGDKGLNIFAANSPYTVSLNCSSSDPGVDVVETSTAGGSSLSYGGGQYNYTWKTEKSWEGTCRQLVVTLNDGSEHRANFKFK